MSALAAQEPFNIVDRPHLTPLEAKLLFALQLMNSWVVHRVEPATSGMGVPYEKLLGDMRIASRAIQEATEGNDD